MQSSKLAIGLDGSWFNGHLFVHISLICFRLPFIENGEYIELRRKIIKALVQIRVLVRNLRLFDQINMPKSKLILEVNSRCTVSISLSATHFIGFRSMNYEQLQFR